MSRYEADSFVTLDRNKEPDEAAGDDTGGFPARGLERRRVLT